MPVAVMRIAIFHSAHPDLVRREIRDATREGHREMGVLWAGPLLEEHFTERARLVFGHTPRTPRYLKRKRVLAAIGKVEDGGRVDIVFSGATKRAAMRARFAVRASHDKTEIPITGPAYFPARNRRRINMGRELTAVSDRHEKLITEAGEKGFDRRHRAIRAFKVFRTKGA